MILAIYILIFILLAVTGSSILKNRYEIHSSFIVCIMLSAALILTLTSFLFFFTLVLNIEFLWIFPALILLLLFLLYYYKNIFSKIFFSKLPVFDTGTIIFLFAVIFTVYFSGDSLKWGGFDSWMIWHLHAKFLMFSEWRNMFSSELTFSHPDYPLLYPAIIAFLWKCTGSINELAPYLLSLFFVIAVPATIYYSIMKNNKWIGLIIGIYLILHEYFVMNVMFQYSDIILSFLILLAVIISSGSEEKANNGLDYFFIGFLISSSAWCKNEGLLFLVCFSISRVIIFYRNRKLFFSFAAGSIIPLAVLCFYKVMYAPPNDLISTANAGMLNKVTDVSRHIMIYKFFIFQLMYKFSIPFLIFMIMLFNISKKKLKYILKDFIFIFLVALGFLFIYLTTFHDLYWHLTTSMSRLIFQLIPPFLFICGYALAKTFPADKGCSQPDSSC